MNNITIDIIGAIVVKAMKEGFTVGVLHCCTGISVTNKEDKQIVFSLLQDEKNNVIEILSDKGYNKIDITEEDELRFKLLIKDCEKYRKSKLIEDINNFFPVKEEPVKTINDLDNEDD